MNSKHIEQQYEEYLDKYAFLFYKKLCKLAELIKKNSTVDTGLLTIKNLGVLKQDESVRAFKLEWPNRNRHEITVNTDISQIKIQRNPSNKIIFSKEYNLNLFETPRDVKHINHYEELETIFSAIDDYLSIRRPSRTDRKLQEEVQEA